MWTRFMDMASGGTQKEDFAYAYIEAPEEEAKIVFYNRFGHNPDLVTCTCCGNDYSISCNESLAELTSYDRNDYVSKYWTPTEPTPLGVYLEQIDVFVIRAEDIKEKERHGELPEEGYIWH